MPKRAIFFMGSFMRMLLLSQIGQNHFDIIVFGKPNKVSRTFNSDPKLNPSLYGPISGTYKHLIHHDFTPASTKCKARHLLGTIAFLTSNFVHTSCVCYMRCMPCHV